MAGGGGTRFWPLSRQKTPKQLLNLSGKELMVNEAIDRLAFTVDKKDIFIVTNATQVSTMMKATKGRIEPNHILSEPSARNTAACIGYAAMEIIKKYGDGVMVITPSDAYISDTAAFTRVLASAVKAAENEDKLVTIGITPTFPATGYGYIKYNKGLDTEAKTVIEFKEKPNEHTAKTYLATGAYAWNSGMFIWKASTILSKFEQHIPDIYADLMEIGKTMKSHIEYDVVEKIYPTIRKVSVDYAIMEPSAENGDVLVVPGEFGWNDVGSWDMMDVLHNTDENGNITIGDTIAINTTNSVVYSSGKLVTAVGVDNLVVVETSDSIMVCHKDKAQDVKMIVDALNAAKRTEFL
ncbi:mannose-1-phosphate guanylyltransferase [Jeotgalibaca porci]|uniref:mannose-1-phosphate guanylyltransferase n=1 Tax=Jeotgalibaca porci TaxID=1868793 RepID=UPI003F93BEE4